MARNLCVLLVDDDEVDRMAVRRALRTGDLTVDVTEVTNAKEAREHLSKGGYDCVLLDFRLPEQNGLSLVRQLRQAGVAIPIIVLTGQGDEQIAVDLMKAGASDYMVKTRVSAESLSQLLRNALRVYRAEQREAAARDALRRTNELLREQNRELERQRQQIQDQNLKLLEAYRVKSEFLATVSHELRTPLNAIMGFSQILGSQSKGDLNDYQAEMVERIFTNGKNLLNLVNDILDLSRLEAQRLTLNPRPFNLPTLVQSTLSELQSLADEKALTITINCDLEDAIIFNDEHRLRQILVNLLSNAIKFTDEGGVELNIRDLGDDKISISVADTGVGIAPEALDHIFEAFRQIDQTLRRHRPGTGLGLAIVHSLVEMMGGTITVKSQLGQGSTFCLEFPRQIEVTSSVEAAAEVEVSNAVSPGQSR
jgi:signal transduction histidine kinase